MALKNPEANWGAFMAEFGSKGWSSRFGISNFEIAIAIGVNCGVQICWDWHCAQKIAGHLTSFSWGISTKRFSLFTHYSLPVTACSGRSSILHGRREAGGDVDLGALFLRACIHTHIGKSNVYVLIPITNIIKYTYIIIYIHMCIYTLRITHT